MSYLYDLMRKYGTDKAGKHSYWEIYENAFDLRRHSVKRVIEIGVKHGASLRVWSEYFTNAEIIGVDIDKRCKYSNDRVKVINMDASNVGKMFKRFKGSEFDVIIDDASHRLGQQLATFTALWPCLKVGGCYVIEDFIGFDYVDIFTCFGFRMIDRRAIKRCRDDVILWCDKTI